MCNIAGYSGTKRAAPILLEMLRQEEPSGLSLSAGIVTLHEGRLFCRKVVGDVDTLIKTTDALYLPGNVGIAHIGAAKDARTYNFAQPFVAEGGRLAGTINGIARGIGYSESVQAKAEFLEDNGYSFLGGTPLEECSFPKLGNGNFVSCAEVRVNLVSYYVNRGYDIETAMARAVSECYTDGVLGVLSLDTPHDLYVLCNSTVAFAATDGDGTYVASCPLAFPDGLSDSSTTLPLMHPTKISREGICISDIKVSGRE